MMCSIVQQGSLRRIVSRRTLKSFASYSSFWKKLATTPAKEKTLQRSTETSFCLNDSSISDLPSDLKEKVKRVSSLCLQQLDEFLELEGKHGPGAVAEGLKANQKWNAILPRLVDLDERFSDIGYDTVFGLHADNIREAGFSDVQSCERARLVCVPKTFTSLRTITVEPGVNQFLQQAYNAHLRKEIERCRVMSTCLALTTQLPNQDLAIEGSLTGDWVTVDLSSASDLLSTELVEAAFAHRPRFLSGIMSCRTPEVEIGNTNLVLKKYAGMGNATTFPVQSYCFALIALCSMIKDNQVVTFGLLERLARRVRVFGDDIIIRTEHYPEFAKWIESCGLRINHSKTFATGNFRESCGVDAYKGIKVTPIYLRFDPTTIATDTSSFISVLSTCNQLWLDCMYATSDALRTMLDKVRTLPLVGRDTPGLGYHTHQNLCERQRWSATLHRYEVRTYVPIPVREKDEIDGYAALMKFYHSPRSGEFDTNHLTHSVRRFNINLRKRWVLAS